MPWTLSRHSKTIGLGKKPNTTASDQALRLVYTTRTIIKKTSFTLQYWDVACLLKYPLLFAILHTPSGHHPGYLWAIRLALQLLAVPHESYLPTPNHNSQTQVKDCPNASAN